MTDLLSSTIVPPVIERVRHELVRRTATVSRSERLTPHMHRITLTGPELAGFNSAGFDDHIKVFINTGGAEPQRRDYTPRRYDAQTGELVLDFAVHEAGPATLWALQAKPGDTLSFGGPRGSQVIRGEIRHWLLIGDETALPAIGRKIEESGAGDRITSLVAVCGAADEQTFSTPAQHTAHWVHRPAEQASDPAPVLAALRALIIEPGTFVWLAAEGTVARALRQHLLEDRNHPLRWLKASGYWVNGQADTVEKFDN